VELFEQADLLRRAGTGGHSPPYRDPSGSIRAVGRAVPDATVTATKKGVMGYALHGRFAT
jgi:hypothetical protein